MKQSLIRKILLKYEYKNISIGVEQSGYRNKSYPIIIEPSEGANGHSRLQLNLILYKNDKDIIKTIQNANSVSNFLASKSFPARKSIGKVMKLHTQNIERYVCLYEYLPGKTISWDSYTKKHIKLLGQSMSEMHCLLNDFNYSKVGTGRDLSLPKHLVYLPKIETIISEQIKRMKSYFNDEGVKNAMERKLNLKMNLNIFNIFMNIVGTGRDLSLPNPNTSSILHMDFVRGNILFDNNESGNLFISGIIDFEKVAFGNKLFDIARTLAFLLVDCKYKESYEIRKYFLYNGYEKRGKSSLPDLTYLNHLVDYFLLYDFYKFLKHNPYESLDQNEHFKRTKNFLLKSKILVSYY